MGYWLPSAPLPRAPWGCGEGHCCPQLPRCAVPLCLWLSALDRAMCTCGGTLLPCPAWPSKGCPHPEGSSELAWGHQSTGTPRQRAEGTGTPRTQGPQDSCAPSKPSRFHSDRDSVPPARLSLALLTPLELWAGFQQSHGSAFSQLLRNLFSRMAEGTRNNILHVPALCTLPYSHRGYPSSVAGTGHPWDPHSMCWPHPDP